MVSTLPRNVNRVKQDDGPGAMATERAKRVECEEQAGNLKALECSTCFKSSLDFMLLERFG